MVKVLTFLCKTWFWWLGAWRVQSDVSNFNPNFWVKFPIELQSQEKLREWQTVLSKWKRRQEVPRPCKSAAGRTSEFIERWKISVFLLISEEIRDWNHRYIYSNPCKLRVFWSLQGKSHLLCVEPLWVSGNRWTQRYWRKTSRMVKTW